MDAIQNNADQASKRATIQVTEPVPHQVRDCGCTDPSHKLPKVVRKKTITLDDDKQEEDFSVQNKLEAESRNCGLPAGLQASPHLVPKQQHESDQSQTSHDKI